VPVEIAASDDDDVARIARVRVRPITRLKSNVNVTDVSAPRCEKQAGSQAMSRERQSSTAELLNIQTNRRVDDRQLVFRG